MPNEYVNELFGLNGQIVVVIGGTGVLGGALCAGVAKAAAHVVVGGRNQQRGEARAQSIREAHGKAEFVHVDASDRDSLSQMLDQVLARHGKVDGLINCAGVNSAVPYDEIEESDWRGVIDGNLTATHLACQLFAPQMASQDNGGSIVNIGSVTAHTPLSRVYAYSASKAAVVNLTQNVAREFAPRNVRVNVLCPGFFPAEQNRKILDADRVDNIMRGTPMARFGEPHELVGAILLLLSQRAGSFITGTALYVDGGFTAMRF